MGSRDCYLREKGCKNDRNWNKYFYIILDSTKVDSYADFLSYISSTEDVKHSAVCAMATFLRRLTNIISNYKHFVLNIPHLHNAKNLWISSASVFDEFCLRHDELDFPRISCFTTNCHEYGHLYWTQCTTNCWNVEEI